MMDSEIEEEVTPTLSLDTSCAALEESLEKERVQIVSPRPKHLTSRAVEMLEALATLDRVAGEDSQEEAVDVDTGDDIGHVSPLDAPFSSPLTLDAALPSAFSPWTPMNTTSSTAMMMQSDSNIDSLEHSPSSLLIPTVPLVPSFAHPLLPLPASTTTTTTSTAKVTTNTYSSSARTKRLCESIKERRRHSRHSSQPFILPPAPASLSTTGVVASDRTIPMGNRQENGSGYPTARRIYHHHHHHYYHHLPLKTHSSRSVDLSAEMRAFIDVDQQQQQPQYY
ncbi:hypothetical protein FRB91_008523 [Serendipita sp. 411]|nr:hypothetical protein FRB91_008523 [Serendipita sp. 411]